MPRNLPPTVITIFLSDPQRTRMSALRIILALVAGALALAAPIAQAQALLPDDFNPGANDWVYSLAVQADERGARLHPEPFDPARGSRAGCRYGLLHRPHPLKS